MSLAPPTPVSLLVRLRDQEDDVAWEEFAELYTPLILAYARHHGFAESDARDVTQEVLLKVVRAMGSFDYKSDIGRFSGWLLTITRNQMRQALRDAPNDRGSGRTTILQMLRSAPEGVVDESIWNRTHRLRLLHWAAEKVRADFQETTWLAFQRAALEGESPTSVASGLGISVGAVYIAKSRVLARVRHVIDRLND